MSRYPLGAPVRVSWRTYQPDLATLVNATANSLTVKLANADGTQAATAGSPYVSPVNDSTGLYHQDVPSSDLGTPGHYQWAATSTGTGAGVAFGEFDIFDPFEASVLPMADAKDALNIPQAVTGSDSEIAQYVETITSSLMAMTGGPLVNTVITERAELDGTGRVLQLRQRPVVSVTSVTPVLTGIPADLSAGLDIDSGAAIVRSKLGFQLASGGSPAVTVVYVAGWGTSVPAAFGVASRIIVQNLWETQHGPSARPSMGGGEEMTVMPGWGFAIPAQAAELLGGTQNGIPFCVEAFA